ncbi:uncharacterized protein N7515_001074 [Penicillium bovifimosum]|uniref:Uncharacterized protein n=1 Tax=Penicillium bovifimosum TaxID=126998 RepID=A0A9W9HGJ6_9EURO|nr:uncharacterized protein N7515_001074 [Penicillium bovifimosum]KAJ5146510.1 hypothetical protein N7515_001074 [Penicillium bovifimosum]
MLDSNSLKAVVLCNSRVYPIAAAILYKTLYLESKVERSPEPHRDSPWKSRIYPIHLCVHVKNIFVVRSHDVSCYRAEFCNGFMKFLSYLFRVAVNLQHFHWWHERYMPGEVLHQLFKYRPQASVHIASWKVALCEKLNSKLSSAPQLSTIRSIEAEWHLGEYDRPIRPNAAASYAGLIDIIYRSHNLESLSLISWGNWGPGRSGYIRFEEVPPDLEREEFEARENRRGLITLSEGKSLPRVKNLHFERMRFGPHQSTLWAAQLQWKMIKYLSLISVDWSHLLPKVTFPGCFHELETLEMSIAEPDSQGESDYSEYLERVEQFHGFLKELPPLQMFMGYGFPQQTLGVLAEYHAKSLRHLRFRYDLFADHGEPGRVGPPISIHNLGTLADQLPNLLSLGINLSWGADWELPCDRLASIVRHNHLQHLELNMRALPERSGGWPYPDVDEGTCRALVTAFDEACLNLLSFHFIVGDWFPFGLPSCKMFHEEAFLVGERDYMGHMRFSNIWHQMQHGELMRLGTFVQRIPPHELKERWPTNLREDIEGRIGNLFWGKLLKE